MALLSSSPKAVFRVRSDLFGQLKSLRLPAAVGFFALALAGCTSIADLADRGTGRNNTERLSSAPGGGDGINDDVLGVSASPVATNRYRNLRRGGGRDQVGRPYTIAGKRYVPREDPNYDKTGIASWYGPGFHGRLTANGEIFDKYTLSAAHPTLPLPSYVRVTNLSNDRSAIVRVNDRGPFARNRIIDLSQRAADVLDIRGEGVGRVRVQFIDRAPLHGQDVEWLEASVRIPGQRRPIANTDIVVAQAPTRAPAPRAVQASPQPATAFVATNDILETRADNGPLDLTPTPVRQPTFAPSVPGTRQSAPLPTGLVGFSPVAQGGSIAGTQGLAAGFVQRNRDAQAQTTRLDRAHSVAALGALEAAAALALQEQLHTTASASPAVSVAPGSQIAVFQVGVFGDPQNVERVRTRVGSLGAIETSNVRSGSRRLTSVQVHASVGDLPQANAVLAQLIERGYRDSYMVSLTPR
ncbi:MAG: septal ring lytic transglycosylase RlpA family protein [Pseudomonadota bacterium]